MIKETTGWLRQQNITGQPQQIQQQIKYNSKIKMKTTNNHHDNMIMKTTEQNKTTTTNATVL